MSTGDGITIVYDGECPFCSRYVAVLRLRESVGPVHLIDARSGDPKVVQLKERGYDLNEGMVAEYAGKTYHGEECVHVLALLSTSSGFFNRFNAALFRSRLASRLLYPIMRAGRNLVLRLLGRSKLA